MQSTVDIVAAALIRLRVTAHPVAALIDRATWQQAQTIGKEHATSRDGVSTSQPAARFYPTGPAAGAASAAAGWPDAPTGPAPSPRATGAPRPPEIQARRRQPRPPGHRPSPRKSPGLHRRRVLQYLRLRPRPGRPGRRTGFIEGCDAVVMGRNTFVPALGAPGWPWPNLQVFVLTSRLLPANAAADVVAVDEPTALAERLRTRGSNGDVHLVSGPWTIRAFYEIGALDRLELLILPVLLGDGLLLWPRSAPRVPLRLLRADRTFPDGSTELVYASGEPDLGH